MENADLQKDYLEQELKRELEKQLQFELEKEKLEETKEIIKNETVRYISKRKDITDYIVKYRQEALEEFKFDEDKIAEYFDHEKYVKEESFKFIDKKLKELIVLSASPYFGNTVFSEAGEEEKIYIGRFGVTREDDLEPVIVDWRAPISSIFYAGKLGEVSYKVPKGEISLQVISKRQFIIKKAALLGMFDSALDVKDEILQMALSKNTGEKLKDIIMTIQQEQDRLIRYERNKTIVVNGVAGSGKTTVALHRVAYLLYNYREILQDKVLIIGPNSIFMDYIAEVLPSLGESGVSQTTFEDFALKLIGIDQVEDFKDVLERVVNNHQDTLDSLTYKGSDLYTEELDKLINTLDKEIFHIEAVKVEDKLVVSREEIEELFYKHYVTMPLFKRSKKVKRIVFSKIKDEILNRVQVIRKKHEEEVKKLSQEQLMIEETDLEYKRKNLITEAIISGMKAKKELLSWIENPSTLDIYNQFNNNNLLSYEDLAPILYLKLKLEGIKYNKDIRHVVIDEAQDYSSLQFKVIKEITNCRSFTIVGDVNQRILPQVGECPMLLLKQGYGDLELEYFNLNTSYRSTKEIMEYANSFIKNNQIIPLVRSGEQVLEKAAKDIEELLSLIETYSDLFTEQGLESIAIICSNLEETHRLAKGLKGKTNIKVIDNEETLFKTGKVIIPSYFAKGLEFDAVIMVDNMCNIKTSKIKYIIATRALHKLVRITYCS